MRWLFFSSELNAIGKQCDSLLQVAGQTVIHEFYREKGTLDDIKEAINEHKPDRIIVLTNETNVETDYPLVRTINDHLLIPLYVGQVTMNLSRPIPVLILTFTNEKQTLDPLSSISVVRNATDELINIYPHIVIAKLIAPISDEELNEKTLLAHFKSLWSNHPEEQHYITILSDVLPILLALLHDGKVNGPIDICNRSTISLNWFEKLLAKEHEEGVGEGLHVSQKIDVTDQFEKWNKLMISPETRHLYQAPFVLANASKSLEQYLQENSNNLNRNSPRSLLITGGCGFIGSTFINHWLKTYPQDQIINIDRLDPVSNTKNIQDANSANYSLIIADINNKDIVLHLMRQYNITHIVHFAVQAHLDSSFGNSITFTESNVYGTHSVLEASRSYGKIEKFIHISTDEVYGETATGSDQETNLLNPINPYAATIAAAEFLVKSYGESFKLSYSIIRLCNVYGPRQHLEKVIPTFINTLLQGEKLKIDGDGKQIRHYLYVDDVIQAIDLIFHKGKSRVIYNIGTSDQLNVWKIAQILLNKIRPHEKLEDIVTYGKARSFREARYFSTTSGAIKALGWKAETSFDQGLEKTIQWYRDNQNYWSK